MEREVFYVRVSGAWDGSPAIYVGPFPEHETALQAVEDRSGNLETGMEDPKHDVRIRIMPAAEAAASGRKDRHTLPPQNAGDGPGFDVPVTLEDFTALYYRLYGRH